MGYDPAGAEMLLASCGDDSIALSELVTDISEQAERYQSTGMLRTASAIRAGNATGKEGYSAYMSWRNQIIDSMKPKPKRTVFDRLSQASKAQPSTVWDRIGGDRGI